MIQFEGKTLILMVGLPYSGKTTRARQLGYPIVCPDAIRLALHGERFLKPAEPMVWTLAHLQVRALFLAGHDRVILDAANTTRARRDEWRGHGWRTRCIFVDTSPTQCYTRAQLAGDAEINGVIARMAEKLELPAADEPRWVPGE